MTMDPREGPLITKAYEDAIEMLVSEGLIDRRRVGAIGWSRTAFHVVQAAWRNPTLFASVTANDGIQRGYMEFLVRVHNGPELLTRVTSAVNGGVPPFNDGLDVWRDKSLTFNIDKTQSAVLVEPIGLGSLLSMWETYSILKFLQKPVELLYHQDGVHALRKPEERFNSHTLNVQWHQFWLSGLEDDKPLFQGQYERWRHMRTSYCEAISGTEGEKPVYCEETMQ